MPNIKLVSSDDQVFDVDVKVAECSVTIKTMLEDLGMPEEEDNDPIPLPNVKGAVLKKILEWATHHKDDPCPVENEEEDSKPVEIGEWDKEFLNVERQTLFDLILAANYLDMKLLLDNTCKTLAQLIKGKTPEEIRKLCNIPSPETKATEKVEAEKDEAEESKDGDKAQDDKKMTLRSKKKTKTGNE